MQTKTISSFVNRIYFDATLYITGLADVLKALKVEKQTARPITPKQRKLLIELRK